MSEDAGATSRTFQVPPGPVRVHLTADRVFLLQPISAPASAFYASALHELDVTTGTFRRAALDTDFGDATAGWFDRDGNLVSVSFQRTRTVRVAKFHARNSTAETFELTCVVEGCDQTGSPNFRTKDGVVFSAVATPTKTRHRTCTVSVDVRRKAVSSACKKASPQPADDRFVIGVGAAMIVQPAAGPSTMYSAVGDQWFSVRLAERPVDDPLCLPSDNTGALSKTCDRTVSYIRIANARSAIAITKERRYKDATKQQWREVFLSKIIDVHLTPSSDPFARSR